MIFSDPLGNIKNENGADNRFEGVAGRQHAHPGGISVGSFAFCSFNVPNRIYAHSSS
jgi:hypothetical protein